MIKPTKKAKNELLAVAEAIKSPRRGWFAMLPPDIAYELLEARTKIKEGKTTATTKGVWQSAKKLYPKDVKCSLSAFRSWFNG